MPHFRHQAGPECRNRCQHAAHPTPGRPRMSEPLSACRTSDTRQAQNVGTAVSMPRFRHPGAGKCRKRRMHATLPTPGRPRMSEPLSACRTSDTRGPENVGSAAPGRPRMSEPLHARHASDTRRAQDVGIAACPPRFRHQTGPGCRNRCMPATLPTRPRSSIWAFAHSTRLFHNETLRSCGRGPAAFRASRRMGEDA